MSGRLITGEGVAAREAAPVRERPDVEVWRRPVCVLAAVAFVYMLVQLLVGRLDTGVSADEAVYLSQFARYAPAIDFSPHRSIGMALLVAPVSAVTGSVTVIRTYLGVLSGVGLFLAYWPWLRIRPGYGVPLAAGLFASLWLTMFYGTAAMPNLYIAFCAVAAVAWFLRATRADAGWAPLAGLAVAVAVQAVLRPIDATAAVGPMVVGMLVVRRWRRLRVALAAGAGLAVGWGQWLIESYARFGGPYARLQETARMNAAGPHMLVLRHLEALSGNLACNPGKDCGHVPLSALAWWAVGGLAVAVAVATARRGRLGAVWWLCLGVAAAMAFPYILWTGYTAPRYLLPSYAVLALPAAAGLITIGTRRGRPWAPAVAALAVAMAVHITGQVLFLDHFAGHVAASRGKDAAVASRLAALGVRPPCLIYGSPRAPNIAYQLKCANWDLAARLSSRSAMTRRIEATAAAGSTVAILSYGHDNPAAPAGWPRTRLSLGHTWHVILSPHAAP